MKHTSLTDRQQTALVFKYQIVHFKKPLDVFGITPNLKVGYCNLPEKKIKKKILLYFALFIIFFFLITFKP